LFKYLISETPGWSIDYCACLTCGRYGVQIPDRRKPITSTSRQ